MARQRSRGLSDRTRRGSAAVHSLLVASAFLAAALAEPGTPRPPQKAPPAQRDVAVQPVPLAGGALYASSWALVVGVNEFQNPKVSRLNYAVNDATSVAQALQALGFPSGNIIRLLNRQATRSEIERVLSSVLRRRAGPQDRAFVFFATHGVTLPLPGGGEEGYLLPYDADPDDLPLTAFSMSHIKLIGQRLPAKHTLVAVDACYGGYSLVRGQSPPVVDKRYLDLISKSRAVQVMTAGRKDQPVIEDQGHGVFTRKLLEGLAGHADTNQDGLITLSELGAWLHPRVAQASDYKQDMQWGNLDGEGQFVFVLPRGQGAIPPVDQSTTTPQLPPIALTPPSPPARPPTGLLVFQGTPPGTTVFLDGKEVGKAPLRLEANAGTYTLRLEAAGYKAREVRIEVKANTEQPIHFELERIIESLSAGTIGRQFNWQRFKGTQLRVVLNKHPWQVSIQPYLKEFEALTGIKVIAEVYPEDQFRAKTLVELTSGASTIDVFMSMPAHEGLKYMRAGWLQPVDEFLKDPSLTASEYDWNDFLEKTREAVTVEGKIIGPPIQVENVSLMYRKDIFRKYNVRVPTTLHELEAAARVLNGKPMTDDGQPGFGIVNRGKRAAATSMFAGMLHAMGGTWLTPNREPAINSEEAIEAIDMWGRLLRLYGPPGSENYHWYEAASVFSQGRAAMYTDANSLWVVIEDPQKSKVIGKVGYALFPRGPKGQYGSTVAVWGLAMAKTSKNHKAAWLFMQWATNKEQVLRVQSERGVLGARESVWKDPKGKARVPADLAESLMLGSKVGTPFWNPPVAAVAEVRDAVGAAIVTSIQGGDVRAAANKAAADMKRIMAETER